MTTDIAVRDSSELPEMGAGRGPKQLRVERFCQEYIKDGNATQAAARAGYSAKTAYAQGCRLLRNVEVARRVTELRRAAATRNAVSADDILQEYARIARFDLRRLFDDAGNLKPVTQWDDDAAAAVESLEVRGDGVVKVKLMDKRAALDSMARVLGMFKDKVAVEVSPMAELMARISKGPSGLPYKR